MADKVLVNSNYTKSVYESTFTSLKAAPFVLYPYVDSTKFDGHLAPEISEKFPTKNFFLSLNRFHPQKNIPLALLSFIEFSKKFPDYQLILAGGFDPTVKENSDTLEKLQSLVPSDWSTEV